MTAHVQHFPERDVVIYDTTLRDGEQGEFIAYSLEDKIRIAQRLDEFGMDYIEGGWPGSNPKAISFFEAMKKIRLGRARLAAFGSTRRKGLAAKDDPQVQMLLQAETPVVTIFGKTWDFHVHEALRCTLEENLEMISDTVACLVGEGREVVYDAEHFFDGFHANPDYALKTLEAAAQAGANWLVLCDTNGGTMPGRVAQITADLCRKFAVPLGIHPHNDAGVATANALAAVQAGATQVQGTVNGYGERCGNVDLIQVIPNLELKFDRRCTHPGQLKELTPLSHFVAEVANLTPDPRQPYVGQTVFAHKGGIHVSAVNRNPATYEHIPPETVGNRRRVLVSEQSGQSNVVYKLEEMGLGRDGSDSANLKEVVQRIKEMEADGYQFEAAEASFALLLHEARAGKPDLFAVESFRVHTFRDGHYDAESFSEAVVKVGVQGECHLEVSEGDGPVNALDGALRKALIHHYPELAGISLTDFKVRVLSSREGTSAKVRVLVTSRDEEASWTTCGVSTNVIEASYLALVDAFNYALLRHRGLLASITKAEVPAGVS
jgi:2-isopropylmalate synthase